MSRAGEWAKAATVVGGEAFAGFIVGNAIGHPVVGVILGSLLGMGVNWRRRCPVCMEHAQKVEELIRGE